MSVTKISAGYQAYLFDSTNGAESHNPPPASKAKGYAVWVKRSIQAGGTITIYPDGSDTIDGDSTYTLATGKPSALLLSDGASGWCVMADK